jgi:hypothetical protein
MNGSFAPATLPSRITLTCRSFAAFWVRLAGSIEI